MTGPINIERIAKAVKLIDNQRKALIWLTNYGVKLTGKSEAAEALFEIHIITAGGNHGVEEAAQSLSAYARTMLPEIVKTAIQGCSNTIAMERGAIADELDKLDNDPDMGAAS